MTSLQINCLSFSYPDNPEFTLNDITLHPGRGWTALVGANGCGKSTLLNLIAGKLKPDSGSVSFTGDILLMEQEFPGDRTPLEEFACSFDAEACRLHGLLGVQSDWPWRWQTLSGGEQKRLMLGAALWRHPDLLILDEPVNHLDSATVRLMVHALKTFHGFGLVISHNRFLLNELCQSTAFLEPEGVTLYSLPYNEALEEQKKKQLNQQREFEKARHHLRKVKKEYNRRKQEASGQDAKNTKKHLNRHDSDGRARIDAARVSGRDGLAGKRLRQMDYTLEKARETLQNSLYRGDRKTGVTIKGQQSRRDSLFSLQKGRLQLHDELELQHPELIIRPGDRISLSGVNGCGKTCFIRTVLLPYLKGREVHFAFMRQIDEEDLTESLNGLPRYERGCLLSDFSRLGGDSRALHTVLEGQGRLVLSPGEIRKLRLAFMLIDPPEILVMDEPVNHLDIVSRECLEEALKELPFALFLVSHDEAFLKNLGCKEWQMERKGNVSVLSV